MNPQTTSRPSDRRGRLAGKSAIVTGGAGNIGREITLRYLAEGAHVAILGRDETRLSAARLELAARAGVAESSILPVVCDGADAGQTRTAVEQVLAHFGGLDVLVNNAGSAGPRRRLEDVPLSRAELKAQQLEGSPDTETAGDAARNIFGISWNMVRAAAPYLRPGASIVNVSTIFSRTKYFGRVAYVVPKAALNAWSRRLAYELGNAGIRVNTVLPGPIESDRIRSVFASMDDLREAPSGTTASEFFDLMTLSRAENGSEPARTFPTIADVANTAVFLASDESAAINGHNFEITHGMIVRQESRSTFVSRPGLRIVDAAGKLVLVAGGDRVDDVLEIARAHASRGAHVLAGFASESAAVSARAKLGEHAERIEPVHFARNDPDAMARFLASRSQPLAGAVILPAHDNDRFTSPLAAASDSDVDAFIDDEIVGALGIARELTRHWRAAEPPSMPRVVFVSNGDDGRGNVYNDILRSAHEELARVWRDESELDAGRGRRAHAEWSNQIVRWANGENESLRFSAAWSTKLIHGKRRVRAVNLYLPESMEEDTGARRPTFGDAESLIGLHLGKVALITGGSAGIGGQIGRLLAIAGARVILAARDPEKLAQARTEIVEELEAIGYHDAGGRIEVMDGVDVADDASLQQAAADTIRRFGAIDYLINNAGIAGAEQMIVDMPVDAWRRTLRANLTSNFSLMASVVPEMKRRGSGYIVNVSSYFGGEKYIAVSYPNRADYAVSKAGQRAIVETMAQFVGPEIQLNAIAPGPVDGVRLRGAGGGPGLFERRGRLILENQRLNMLYSRAIEYARSGGDAEAFFGAAMRNDVARLANDPSVPKQLSELCREIAASKPADPDCASFDFLMSAGIATKLAGRLSRGGRARIEHAQLEAEPPEPFFPLEAVRRHAEKVRSSVLKMLHLQKMPTETEVALATVYFLADRAISGETFHPSGGLKQDRSVTERELFGRSKEERIEQLRGRTVWVIGEHPPELIARAVKTYLEECHAGRVVLMTRTKQTGDAVCSHLSKDLASRVSCFAIGLDIEAGLQRAIADFEPPVAVVSMPMGSLPLEIFGEGGMTGAGFDTLLEEQVTNHFRVTRMASLIDDARIILVGPQAPFQANTRQFALAGFIKTALHALTATAAVENERIVHEAPVNQINPTRQVQSDEPCNETEVEEKFERFARAIVLESGPIPHAGESRYRARVYRGVAITV